MHVEDIWTLLNSRYQCAINVSILFPSNTIIQFWGLGRFKTESTEPVTRQHIKINCKQKHLFHFSSDRKTKLSEMIFIILKEILFFLYISPIYQQAKIKLFMVDKTWSKEDFSNIQVPLKWNWAKYSWQSEHSQVDCLK